MTISKPVKAVLITIAVLLVLAAIIIGIVFWCLSSGYNPEERLIHHDYLQTVMADDVVYLSDGFMTENSLEWQPSVIGMIAGEKVYSNEYDVSLSYNNRKVDGQADFTQRVKNVDYYSYELKSAKDCDGIPVSVTVTGNTKDNYRSNKYDQKYGDYNYCVSVDSTTGDTVYYIKTTPKTLGTCILKICVSVENKENYTDEQITARQEQIFKSAVDNIVKYGD